MVMQLPFPFYHACMVPILSLNHFQGHVYLFEHFVVTVVHQPQLHFWYASYCCEADMPAVEKKSILELLLL